MSAKAQECNPEIKVRKTWKKKKTVKSVIWPKLIAGSRLISCTYVWYSRNHPGIFSRYFNKAHHFYPGFVQVSVCRISIRVRETRLARTHALTHTCTCTDYLELSSEESKVFRGQGIRKAGIESDYFRLDPPFFFSDIVVRIDSYRYVELNECLRGLFFLWTRYESSTSRWVKEREREREREMWKEWCE